MKVSLAKVIPDKINLIVLNRKTEHVVDRWERYLDNHDLTSQKYLNSLATYMVSQYTEKPSPDALPIFKFEDGKTLAFRPLEWQAFLKALW